MTIWNYQLMEFLASAPDNKSLPSDTGIEVAFAGRSNAGKSSAINALSNQKKLARISKVPGSTQLITLFKVAKDKRLVDLPGYGYAQAPKKIRIKWQHTLSEYLERRLCLKGLVVLMDIRHPLKDLDQKIIYWAIVNNISILVLLTKADQISNSKSKAQVTMVRKAIVTMFNTDVQVAPFSSIKKQGIDILRQKLNNWLN